MVFRTNNLRSGGEVKGKFLRPIIDAFERIEGPRRSAIASADLRALVDEYAVIDPTLRSDGFGKYLATRDDRPAQMALYVYDALRGQVAVPRLVSKDEPARLTPAQSYFLDNPIAGHLRYLQQTGAARFDASRDIQVLPLRKVSPIQLLNPTLPAELAILNHYRDAIHGRLHRLGWTGRCDTDILLLASALLGMFDDPPRLPIVSAAGSTGRRLLLNGHHRMAALLTLVTDDLLPDSVLRAVPFAEMDIDPQVLLPRFGITSWESSRLLKWSDVMWFKRNTAPRKGNTGNR